MTTDGRGLLYSFLLSHDSTGLPSFRHRRDDWTGTERTESGRLGCFRGNTGEFYPGQSWFGPVRRIHCCLSPKKNKKIHFCLPSPVLVCFCCSSSPRWAGSGGTLVDLVGLWWFWSHAGTVLGTAAEVFGPV